MEVDEHFLLQMPRIAARILLTAALFTFLNIRAATGAETVAEAVQPVDSDFMTISIPPEATLYALSDLSLMKYRATGHENLRPFTVQIGVILWDERKIVVPTPVLQRTSGTGSLQNSVMTAVRLPQ